MAKTPRDRYERDLDRLEAARDDNDIAETDYERIRGFLDAYDGQVYAVSSPESDSTKAATTLSNYCTGLRGMAERLDGELLGRYVDDDLTRLKDADATAINALMGAYETGDHPDVKDGGFVRNTVVQHQGTIRKFYRFHDDLGVDPDDIEMKTREGTEMTEEDVLAREEIHDMMDEAPNLRDRAMVAVFAYTGQRLRAVQTLRVQDVLLGDDRRRFRLNPDGAGLKGADGTRPLLGARKPVKDWLSNGHPCPDDDNAAVFTPITEYNPDVTLGEPLHPSVFTRRLKQCAERAGIDRDRVHPHCFRHTFVTFCKRDYGLDDAHIKRLIGHDEGSNVMETTYSHLTDNDAIVAIEEAAGLRDEEDTSPLTPPECPTCHEPLRPTARFCDACGAGPFGPDQAQLQQEFEEDREEADDGEIQMILAAMQQALEDDEAVRNRAAKLVLGENTTSDDENEDS
jgi:integrase/recombinase XerD